MIQEIEKALTDCAKASERLVLGVVLEPSSKLSADEVRKAAHGFMVSLRKFKAGGDQKADVSKHVRVLESYIAPNKLTFGKRKVPAGAWLLALRIVSNKLWKQIQSGKFQGLDAVLEDKVKKAGAKIAGERARKFRKALKILLALAEDLGVREQRYTYKAASSLGGILADSNDGESWDQVLAECLPQHDDEPDADVSWPTDINA